MRAAAGSRHADQQPQGLRVGPLEVVDDEQQRRAARGALERVGEGVEAGEPGGARIRARLHGRRRRGPAGVRERAEDGGERLRRVLVGHGGQHRAAARVDLGGERCGQPRLADAGRPGDERCTPRAARDLAPRALQPLQRVRPADERTREATSRQRCGEGRPLVAGERPSRRLRGVGRPGGRGRGAGRRRGGRRIRSARRLRADAVRPADPLGELARRRRRHHRELAPQADGQPLVLRQRAADVARCHEVAHQRPVGGLVELVERGSPARAADRLVAVTAACGLRGKPAERRAAPLAVRVARRDGPLVLQTGQQVGVAERQRGRELTGIHERGELQRVDLHVIEPDRLATRPQRARRRAERPAQRRQCGAQARACALVEDVGPQGRGDVRTRRAARVQREPGEEGAGGASVRRQDRAPAGLEPELSDQPYAQHGERA